MGNEIVGTALLAAKDTGNEVDFFIHGLIKYKFFGQDVWITTTHVSLVIVTIVLVAFMILANRRIKRADEVPKGFQNVVELIVEMIDNLVKSSMGANGQKFANYIGTIFIFILVSNLSGLFGLRPPTADYGVTLPLGLITFGMIQYNGIKKNKIGHFTSLFKPIPLLFPINIIGEIAVPFSLSLRLFGNILSGTVILALFYGLLPIFVKVGLPSFLHVYCDIFSGAIQAFVFSMLTMAFVNEKVSD